MSSATTKNTVNKTSVTSSPASAGSASFSDSFDSVLNAAEKGITNLGNGISDFASDVGDYFSNLISDFGSAFAGSLDKVSFDRPVPEQNILHNFTTYNYNFTLSALTTNEYNFPDNTYRTLQEPNNIICKSASGSPNNRVQTAVGKFDFYMDNVRIDATMGIAKSTGNTNATALSFTIVEPYSMGLFFQSIQAAAIKTGHYNYIDAPYLLTLEFKGHVSPDDQGYTVDKTTKYFPIKLRNIEMRVTNRGAEYFVEAYPYNESAYNDTYVNLKADASITGTTVHEVLQTGTESLQAVVNAKLKTLAETTKTDPDKILIYFPKDFATGGGASSSTNTLRSATTTLSSFSAGGSVNSVLNVSVGENKTLVQNTADINAIGSQKMGFDSFRGGVTPFTQDNFAYDEEKKVYVRGNIQIDVTNRIMSFAQDSNVIDIINQVILTSEFGRAALNNAQITSTGKIPWWRVESQMYLLPNEKNIIAKGAAPKLIVYRVVPYYIDAAMFRPPNETASASVSIAETVVREYNYIYTSKNLDIIDFELFFNVGFYQALQADAGQNTEAAQTSQNVGSSGKETPEVVETPVTGSAPTNSNPPETQHYNRTKSYLYNKGGTTLDPSMIAAYQAQNVFMEGYDMVNVKLKIIGDPYYIGDSGMGNYSAKLTSNDNINVDNAIDYQSGDVFIKLNFRTPLDLNVNTSTYDFGDTQLVSQFSGLYRVVSCENTFKDGKFIQTLDILRQPGQVTDPNSASSGAQKLLSEAKTLSKAISNIDPNIAGGIS